MPSLQIAEEAFDRRTDEVLAALDRFDFVASPAWSKIELLANHVDLDDVEADPAGIIFDADDTFRGSLSVYVVLRFGSQPDDDLQSAEAFRGSFSGLLDADGKAAIQQVDVDVRSFFEGEAA